MQEGIGRSSMTHQNQWYIAIYIAIYIYILVTLVYSTIYISTLLFIMHAWHFAQKLVKC